MKDLVCILLLIWLIGFMWLPAAAISDKVKECGVKVPIEDVKVYITDAIYWPALVLLDKNDLVLADDICTAEENEND